MAVPSSIVLTPDESLDSALPIVANVTASDLFERPLYDTSYFFTPVDSTWKGGALQTDSLIGDGFLSNGVDARVDLTSKIPTYTDFIFVSFWVRFPIGVTPNNSDRIFSLNDGNYSIPINVLYDASAGGFVVVVYRTFSIFKITLGNVLAVPGQWYNISTFLDTATSSIPAGLYVDGVNTGSTTARNDSFSAMPTSNQMWAGGYAIGGNTQYGNAEICNVYLSNDRNIVSDIPKYANIPTTEIDSTDISPTRYISETEYEVTIPSLSVGVKNFDIANSSGTGSTTFEVTPSAVDPNYTLSTNGLDFELEHIEEGYESSIRLPWTQVEKENKQIRSFDDGSVYDIYTCRFSALMTKATYELLRPVYEDNKDQDFTLVVNGGGGFSPFTPAYGDQGTFTFKIKSLKQSGTLDDERYQWFRISFEVVNSGDLPSYSPISSPNEGVLQIGTIGGLRYPIGGYQPSVSFDVSSKGTAEIVAYSQDWANTSEISKMNLRLLFDKMSSLVKHLLSERTNQISILVPSGHYPFGAEGGDNQSFNSRLISKVLRVKHVNNKRYEISLDFQRVVNE